MMKDKIIRHSFVVGLLLCSIIQFSLYSQATSLNNELIAWGFKRGENNAQPELDLKAKRIVEEFEGITIGNSKDKSIYLTFDCGYEDGYTDKILDVLEENNVKAVFFITGHYLNTASDLVKRMIEDGHTVGNHTVNHKCLSELTDEEIKKEIMNLHTAVYEKFGYEMKYFRPPKGEFSQRVIKNVKDLGYTTVMWSSAYDDWNKNNQGREEYGKKKILDNVHNGCVLLLHSTSKDNCNILGDVIKDIKNKGYEFYSIEEFK